MIKRIKAFFKNEKGLTLVELLAVIVILGIIAAIAVPSIGKIIDKSKIDAQISNAQQMISATRLAVAANDDSVTDDDAATLSELVTGGYMEELPDNPSSNSDYDQSASSVTIKKTGTSQTYTVTLVSGSVTYVNNATPTQLSSNKKTSFPVGN